MNGTGRDDAQRPKITLKKTRTEIILTLLTSVCVLATIMYTVIVFPDLPAEVPSKIDDNGNIYQYVNKWLVWLIPATALVLYGVMLFIAKIPHSYNYMQKITAATAPVQYRLAVVFMAVVHFLTQMMLVIVQIDILSISREARSIISLSEILFLVALLTAAIIFYMSISFSKKAEQYAKMIERW